jgi:hypothetical protein
MSYSMYPWSEEKEFHPCVHTVRDIAIGTHRHTTAVYKEDRGKVGRLFRASAWSEKVTTTWPPSASSSHEVYVNQHVDRPKQREEKLRPHTATPTQLWPGRPTCLSTWALPPITSPSANGEYLTNSHLLRSKHMAAIDV